MNESQRTPREADPGASRREARRTGGGAAEPRTPRTGGGAGRPADGSERGWNPFEDEIPGGAGAGAAADWERLRSAATGGAGGDPHPPGSPPSLASLVVLLEALRGMVPHELERQFSALVREALLTLRALIDWYLERLDGGAREPRVEDIPID